MQEVLQLSFLYNLWKKWQKTECNLWLCPQEKSLCTGQLSGFKKPIALNH
jgi:hypothetical protein